MEDYVDCFNICDHSVALAWFSLNCIWNVEELREL
jgi:hypothetical protein